MDAEKILLVVAALVGPLATVATAVGAIARYRHRLEVVERELKETVAKLTAAVEKIADLTLWVEREKGREKGRREAAEALSTGRKA